ncbi:MAG TPA: TIGR03118 family protein [Silvibacterium sp.]|jgi:uncharacterized protein (TIGR03118 family)|nr:TIGR03118 family protein [Silvibacterium sp.]
MRNRSKILKTVAVVCTLAFVPVTTFAQHYTQTNLVSDLANVNGQPVAVQDPSLKNAWGLARSASSPWWVNNAGTGTSTLYSGTGAIIAPPSPVVVPNAPNAKGLSSPTGIIFNGTTDFMIKNVPGKAPTPAAFIFATQEGTISAWNPATTPLQLAVNEVTEKGADFTGLTWIEDGGNHFLLAANFSQNRIEKFDTNYKRVHLSEELFDDDALPRGFAPYNVQSVGANVVVTYAKLNPEKTGADDDCGEECGFVDVFTSHGRLVQRLQHVPGTLKAPWGVALAPQDFGFFSHDLLIGNRFGGTIAAFNIADGRFLGNLLDADDSPIVISGLWGLEFDNRGNNQASPSAGPALFFAAGINGYADGLFGTLTPVAAELNAEDHQ